MLIDKSVMLHNVIQQATQENIKQGTLWYINANEFAKQLSEEFNISLEKVAGIISALSVQKSWSVNKRIAREYFQGKKNIHTKVQVSKCDWIMRGDNIEKCLGGMKTINFYHNLLEPKDNNWFTIDRHILNIFNETPKLTPKKYNQLKQVCINYSEQTPWVSPEVQAIAWVVVRGKSD